MRVLEAVLEVLSVGVLAAGLGVASASDLSRRIVPNGCVAAVAASGAARAAVRGTLPRSALGALVVLAVMLAAAAASARLSGRPGVGGGDVKLLAAVGAWAGPVAGLAVVGASCALGAAGWAARTLAARVVRRPAPPPAIPLAPAIALCALVAVLAQPPPAP